MKSKKNSFLIHHDLMVEGMIFSIKTFAIVCVISAILYFVAGSIDRIAHIFSL